MLLSNQHAGGIVVTNKEAAFTEADVSSGDAIRTKVQRTSSYHSEKTDSLANGNVVSCTKFDDTISENCKAYENT